MKGNDDHSTGKQDNKPSQSGGKSKLPLYICAGVVALALAIGGHSLFADNAANPGVENNLPQDPDDPYNNGGVVVVTGSETSPVTTATPTPEETPEITLTPTPPEPAPSWEVTLDPISEEVITFLPTSGAESPYVSPYNTTDPTAPATIAPTPSTAPATPNDPTASPIPPPTGTPKPVPTPNNTPQPTKTPVETPDPTPKKLTEAEKKQKIDEAVSYIQSKGCTVDYIGWLTEVSIVGTAIHPVHGEIDFRYFTDTGGWAIGYWPNNDKSNEYLYTNWSSI